MRTDGSTGFPILKVRTRTPIHSREREPLALMCVDEALNWFVRPSGRDS
jgi:hypothetical protein